LKNLHLACFKCDWGKINTVFSKTSTNLFSFRISIIIDIHLQVMLQLTRNQARY